MFSYVSSIVLLVLLVMTCAFQAIHTRDNSLLKNKAIVHRQDPENLHGDTLGNSNADCSTSGAGQTGPFKCQDGFACVNTAYLLRHACQACGQGGLFSSDEDYQCLKMTHDYDKVPAVKVSCSITPWERLGCAYPVVSAPNEYNKRWIDWGSTLRKGGLCPCLKGYLDHCEDKESSEKRQKCVVHKMGKCPSVCTPIKMRVNDAWGFGQRRRRRRKAKGDQKLIERASVLVDSQGKPIRNASASMMSLDDTVSGKCSQ